jgi:YHS domain-containing protein
VRVPPRRLRRRPVDRATAARSTIVGRGTLVAISSLSEAGMTKCAVCEKTIKKAEAPSKTTHLGVAYYFCSEVCEKKFETHRHEFIQKHEHEHVKV